MRKNTTIIFGCLIIIFILLTFCTKDKSIFKSNLDIDYYLSTWPDTLYSESIGLPNLNLPLAAQRASAYRAARVNLYQELLDSVYTLPISKNENIGSYCSLGQHVDFNSDICDYIMNYNIDDTIYFIDGSVKLIGYITTDSLKVITIEYLMSIDN